ncbi:MAG: hypothetical protein ACM3ZV_02135 [Bacillota bacterium]
MPRMGRIIASAVISLSLIGSSTAALAQAPLPSPSSDAWLSLSMLSPSGAAVLGTTAVAAAQPTTQTCPDGSVIPASATCAPPPGTYTGPSTPPVAVLAIWALVLGTMVYIATKNNHSHPVPNSPA